MQHRSIFQRNTVLLASIIVQLAIRHIKTCTYGIWKHSPI